MPHTQVRKTNPSKPDPPNYALRGAAKTLCRNPDATTAPTTTRPDWSRPRRTTSWSAFCSPQHAWTSSCVRWARTIILKAGHPWSLWQSQTCQCCCLSGHLTQACGLRSRKADETSPPSNLYVLIFPWRMAAANLQWNPPRWQPLCRTLCPHPRPCHRTCSTPMGRSWSHPKISATLATPVRGWHPAML